MFSLSVAQAVALLETYRYLLIFPIVFVEGPIITVICGWLVATGQLNFFLIYLLIITANLSCDSMYYAIGYWGGPAVIKRWGYWFRINLEQTIKLKNHFDNHGGKILLVAKITPHFAATVGLAGAGLAHYRFRLFFRYCASTEVIKTLVFLLVGYFIGDAYQEIVNYLNYFGAIISLAMVCLLVYGFYYWRKSFSREI